MAKSGSKLEHKQSRLIRFEKEAKSIRLIPPPVEKFLKKYEKAFALQKLAKFLQNVAWILENFITNV